mgnify:FL=1|jgi:gamma-glutamylcyclotransferase (GGCT)/AIG2-like uncharacterized protein YtfP
MMPQHLFVYGTLRPQLAHGEARTLIADLEIVGSATVQGKLYDFGAYPGVKHEKGIVFGDLLRLTSTEQLRPLDAYEECNGRSPLFTRSVITAQSCTGTSIAAWIYLFSGRTESGVLIASGDYQQYIRSRLSH